MKSIIIIFCFLTVTIISGQEKPDPASFFPSAVGNVWEYITQSGTYKSVIIRDSIGTDSSRFLFYPSSTSNDRVRFQIDTSLNVFYIPYGLNWLYYKLDADLGETWKVRTDPPGTLARVDKIYTANLWGEERYVKEIGFYRPPYPFEDAVVTEETVYESYVLLVSGIGEYYEFDFENGPERILLGCIIDGIMYGTVDVEELSQIIPSKFVLYQNYPNPFNPTTKIKYTIPQFSFVTVKIYDLLGREITTLVNEEQSAGTYEIEFSANGGSGSKLSSGIYIYTIRAGNYAANKKMVLTK